MIKSINRMKTIVWDIDDVLNDLMRVWFTKSWLKSHPLCSLKYDDIKENPPHRLLGVSLNEYLVSLDKFRLSDDYPKLKPNAEVLTWFKKFGKDFRHMALTGTPLFHAPISSAWLMRHFGKWIRSYNFVPASRGGEDIPLYDSSKAEFMAWFAKTEVFVDDDGKAIEKAKSLGIKTVLISQPWNNGKLTLTENLSLLASLTH